MNNSYMFYAKKGKAKYHPLSNLLFFLGETGRFNRLFLICLLFVSVPMLLANYLGTLLPAVLVEGLTRGDTFQKLLLTIGTIGIGYILSNILAYMMQWYQIETRRYFPYHLTKRFLTKVREVDYELLENADFQEIYSNAWNSASNGRGFFDGYYMFPGALTAIFGIVLFGWILGSRSLVILGLVFVCVGVNLYLLSIARKVHKKYFGKISKYAKGEAYISEITMDSAAGKDIRIYNMLDFILKKYDENLNQIGNLYGKIHNWYCFRNGTGAVLSFARDALAYLFLIREMVAGRVTAAEFVFLLGVIDSLADYFESFLRVLMGWNTLDASVGYFRQFLETESRWRKESAISKEKLEEIRSQGVELELSDVSYTYEGAKEPTIKHFNLKIRQGEKLALIGLNGAGKTTLVKLISGLYTPDEGNIRINGMDRNEFTREEYTSLISIMFQDSEFLPLSVDENLTAQKQCDRERLMLALKQSGFLERYESIPGKGSAKLIKKLEENAVDFSGGEKQKLIFARAIYREAPLVILDEPTAALDPIAENELYCNFKEAIGSRTAIYISHRLSSTRFCDRIVLLEQGKIVEEGTHESLLAKGGRYTQLYEMQSKYYHEQKVRQQKQKIMEEGGEPA